MDAAVEYPARIVLIVHDGEASATLIKGSGADQITLKAGVRIEVVATATSRTEVKVSE